VDAVEVLARRRGILGCRFLARAREMIMQTRVATRTPPSYTYQADMFEYLLFHNSSNNGANAFKKRLL
jgi:hypothetical protein